MKIEFSNYDLWDGVGLKNNLACQIGANVEKYGDRALFAKPEIVTKSTLQHKDGAVGTESKPRSVTVSGGRINVAIQEDFVAQALEMALQLNAFGGADVNILYNDHSIHVSGDEIEAAGSNHLDELAKKVRNEHFHVKPV